MKKVCRKCGYEEEIGKEVDIGIEIACSDCGSSDVLLVDTGMINVQVQGLTPDKIGEIFKGMVGDLTVGDLLHWFGKQKRR